MALLDQANIALGRLDSLSIILPDPSLFLYMYIRKEAVLSSQIEGTQLSLSDLLLYENQEVSGVPNQDVIEVSNYVAAMEHGLERIKGGFPLSLRLIREMHEMLLSRAVAALNNLVNFVAHKIGLVTHDLVMLNLFPLLQKD
jgi:Fic family protein